MSNYSASNNQQEKVRKSDIMTTEQEDIVIWRQIEAYRAEMEKYESSGFILYFQQRIDDLLAKLQKRKKMDQEEDGKGQEPNNTKRAKTTA